MNLIGLSISLCVKDICEGRVKLSQVAKIISGTRCVDDESWKGLIKLYRKQYWQGHPDKAEGIFRHLLAEGKIEQPRLKNDNRFPLTRWGKKEGVIWVGSEAEINWSVGFGSLDNEIVAIQPAKEPPKEMQKYQEGRKHIDPRLLALMDAAEKEKGIFIQNLQSGDHVEVITRNTVYNLKVIDPKKHEVEVTSNGKFMPGPTITYVEGSSLTGRGTMIKIGWIAPGYRLLLGGGLLSTTQKVSVNGQLVASV